ncbi:MAG: hypothetical protein WBC19_09250 [Pyrinomonadaceae bacterium]
MSKSGSFTIKLTTGLFIIFAIAKMASAQMTIFNIPSTDTLEKKGVYFEADFVAKPVSYDKGGFQTYGYRVVYGLGHTTEIGANFYYTRDGGDSVAELQVNAKQTLFQNEKHGIAATAGFIASTPLRDTRGAKRYALIYSNVSKTIEQLKGLRVTGGVYTVVGGGDDFGTKTGAIVGVEQPITKRVSFLADWFSGKNRFGYASVGLNFAVTKKQFILLGYNFGNSGAGNNSLAVFYGYTF